ncbi:MAG: Antilisterial bacteriocin subtilosin biosynthesis protein AlbA [Deltaproteobacteria bacterium ADurb.Bin207]|nr:MAG: Antilisterial bacteriocin subtilosin biosynthesis protein AlbA [Deltaproteobacteria bacterium ADurb.Bin207]HQB43715.1 radical SAM protein [Polyangiaceae bacterium]
MAGDWITFELTDRCQLTCKHCLRDPGKRPTDLPLPLVRSSLEQAKCFLRSFHAAFTGGEPVLHPEFSAILDAAVDLDYTWHMVTNGQRFERVIDTLLERPLRKEKLTALTISLDGADEATHDAIRSPGSYREVMKAASLCMAHEIPFAFNTTLHAKNVHQLESMGLLASQLGADRISFILFSATGTKHDAELYLSARQWRNVMDRIDRLAEALTIRVNIPEGFHRKQPWHVCAPFTGQQIHVDVHGRVILCCQHAGIPRDPNDNRDIVGSLYEMNLAEACRRFLGIVHRFQEDKMLAMERGELKDDWDYFPCNYCMKYFGKPYWTSEGAAGPSAIRARRKKRLPVLG